jgi:tRNA-specific adenosine deaminase 3
MQAFERLKTIEEEREMTSIDAYAIEIKQEDIHNKIKEPYFGEYLRFLKKIKRTSENKILLLKGVGTPPSDAFVHVKIPSFEPITKEQYDKATEIWPCHFYGRFQEKIDENETNKQLEMFLEQLIKNKCNYTFCSGLCTIFDENEHISTSVDQSYILDHGIMNCISEVSRSKRGYLCTGYVAFIYREPCTSCAMALVHGRIKRLYVIKKVEDGPFSKYKMNYNKNLNHRFNVYFYKE